MTSVLNSVLTAIVKEGASDIHLRSGSAPAGRVNGVMVRYGDTRLSPEHVEGFAREMMIRPGMWDEFQQTREADFAYGIAGLARFRVNAYYQRGTMGLIMRVIEEKGIPSFEQLGLPRETFEYFGAQERGLVLVTGPTGSGKTTTLASLIDHINATQPVNIVTLEDPIEVLHKDKQAMISQRELGIDTMSFSNGLRAAMRQDPDVILIGEMRDKETVEAALSAAQTGHLVLSTLHTQDAIRTVNRIIDFFPPHERDQIRVQLSESLVGILSQRLLQRADGVGRALASEVLINTPLIQDYIRDEQKTPLIKDALMEDNIRGMRTFDQHLVELHQHGLISMEDAMEAATSPHELKLMVTRSGFAY